MLTNTLKMSSLLLVTLSFAAPAQPTDACLGELFSYREEPPEITPPPTVKIVEQGLPQLKAGETLSLTTEIVAQGQATLMWCAPTGEFMPNAENLTTVTYQAPPVIVEDIVVPIGVQADDNGYVGGDTILAFLQKSVATQAAIVVGTTENKLLVYSPAGTLQTSIDVTQGNIYQIAALDADNDQQDEIAVKNLSGVYELNGELNSTATAQTDFMVKADVDGDRDLETILGSQNSYQVTVDGTAFSVFPNARRGTRDGKRDDDDDDKGKNAKITICHNGNNTLSISESAWKAHEGHGDIKGACPPPKVDPPKIEPPTKDTTTGSGTTTTTGTTTTSTTDDTNQGVNVAAGDLDGDGKAAIVAAMAKEGSTVEIHRGDGSLISSFEAFDNKNGVIVTVGDVNNDGMADIVVGDAGGTAVKIFTVANGQATQLSTFNIDSGAVASLAVAKGILTPVTKPTDTTTTETPTPSEKESIEKTPVVQPVENPREVLAPLCQIAADGINTSCSGNGMILTTNMTIDSLLSIANVKIAAYILNHGWLSNSKIFVNGIVTGGTLTGDIENEGLIIDITFKGRLLKGGKLKNRIKILADVSLRLGIVEDVTLDEGTHLSGGRLQGKIQGSPKKPALLEDTEIAEGTYLSHVIIGKGVKFLGRGAHEEYVQRIKVTE